MKIQDSPAAVSPIKVLGISNCHYLQRWEGLLKQGKSEDLPDKYQFKLSWIEA